MNMNRNTQTAVTRILMLIYQCILFKQTNKMFLNAHEMETYYLIHCLDTY